MEVIIAQKEEKKKTRKRVGYFLSAFILLLRKKTEHLNYRSYLKRNSFLPSYAESSLQSEWVETVI